MFDKLEATLERVAKIPPEEFTLEERLRLWAQLEMVRLKLTDVVQRGAS